MCPASPRNPRRLRNAGADHSSGAAALRRLRAGAPPALRYGLTLNDRGYFWEAQEILEAVWAAAPQGGRERILLRACILIATANLRLRMQKPHVTARLFGEALGELEALGMRTPAATGLPMAFRSRRWRPSSRPNWSGRSSEGRWVAFAAASRT